jgi:hypothetical protein
VLAAPFQDAVASDIGNLKEVMAVARQHLPRCEFEVIDIEI